MIIKAIRLIALCASMFGYMRFISRRIAPELSIGFTFTAIGSVMLAAGLLNALPELGVKTCYYGHLHGDRTHKNAVQGEYKGIDFHLISCDYTRFVPVLVR